MTNTVTIRYGMEETRVDLAEDAKFADLKANRNLRASLGYGDNIKMLVQGIEMPNDAIVPWGSVVVVETAANQKAVLLAA